MMMMMVLVSKQHKVTTEYKVQATPHFSLKVTTKNKMQATQNYSLICQSGEDIIIQKCRASRFCCRASGF